MQFTFTTVLASVALLSTLSAAAPAAASLDSRQIPAGTVTVQLDGNDPPGEDARQISVKTDNSVAKIDQILIGAFVVKGAASCKLYSDFNGVVSINKPFSTGKEVIISPPLFVGSIRCSTATAAEPKPAPKPAAATITVQLDGNDPPGEDAIQKDVVLDGSAQPTGDRVLIAASVVKGSGNCKLYSDLNGNVSINKPFSTGKAVTISPPTLARSIRCTV